MSQQRDDQRWMTYKQSVTLGGQVRKGEKGTGIQYWKFTDELIKKDAAGKPVLDNEGHPVKGHGQTGKTARLLCDGVQCRTDRGFATDPAERANLGCRLNGPKPF